jgi:predicted RNA methylase
VTGRVIEPLLGAAGVGAGQAVADLATGPGYVAAGVRARGAVPIGVDVAGAMVELAKELHPGIEFIQASAATQQRIRAAFDARIAELRTYGEVELPTLVKIASARKAVP